MWVDLAGSSFATDAFSLSDLGFLSTLISEALQFLHVNIEALCSFTLSCGVSISTREKLKNN